MYTFQSRQTIGNLVGMSRGRVSAVESSSRSENGQTTKHRGYLSLLKS